ncbi:unnamed protein product [Gadus morhua 'NCC']
MRMEPKLVLFHRAPAKKRPSAELLVKLCNPVPLKPRAATGVTCEVAITCGLPQVYDGLMARGHKGGSGRRPPLR